MKHKLTPTERAERLDRRAKARADKASRVEAIRDWFDARRAAADKRRTEAANQPRPARGVDRVPARYRITPPAPEYVVEHTGANRAQRRAWALGQGRSIPASGNETYVNPARNAKSHRAGRLRKELQP